MNIKELIPQREPIIMVDDILAHEEKQIKSCFLINSDNIFVENGCLTESGLLENIAQTAASKVGLEAKNRNEKIPLGFIGAITKVVVHAFPSVGDTILTEVVILQEVFNITLIAAKVFSENTLLVECQMKIALES
jgi:predicted hotdog family 3-hydroxylacyl-ACP dehydratase